MSKKWSLKIDDQMYDVELKGRKLKVNGESLKLRKFRKKTGLIHEEYEIPLGPKNALLVIRNMSAPVLAVDNKDCATGEEYVPVKMPKWAYIFVVLHCVNFLFLGGALGVLIIASAITMTASISSNKKLHVVLRVLLDLALVALVLLLDFAIALMLI